MIVWASEASGAARRAPSPEIPTTGHSRHELTIMPARPLVLSMTTMHESGMRRLSRRRPTFVWLRRSTRQLFGARSLMPMP